MSTSQLCQNVTLRAASVRGYMNPTFSAGKANQRARFYTVPLRTGQRVRNALNFV